MMTTGSTPTTHAQLSKWKAVLAPHERPHLGRATWQVVNSLGSYLVLWGLMYWSISVSLWLTVCLAALATGLLLRIFIIFHDCVHSAFFHSRRANVVLGFVTGLLTYTPYTHWRWSHLRHHATSGNLHGRGTGDIWTMTVEEYMQSSPWKRRAYQLMRHPLFQFGLGPVFHFLVLQRIPPLDGKPQEKLSVWIMNLALVGLTTAGIAIFGLWPWVILQFSILAASASVGIWLFYVQHQFEDTYWERKENWNYVSAALQGSTFYKLPRVLQWLTGNIGFHHIHHLSPRIPNYNLEACHRSHPEFAKVKTLTLLGSLKLARLRLWDEESKQLISFRKLRQLRPRNVPVAERKALAPARTQSII